MPYEIETKDGIVIRGIPDTVKPDDPSLKAKVANARFQRDAANPDYRKAGEMALEGMTAGDKFDAGVGKAIVDTGRGLRQVGRMALDVVNPRAPTLSGLVTGQDPSRSAEDMRDFGQTRARDAALMDTGAGIAGNVVGNIGMTLAPGGLLKGASMSAAAGRAAPALSAAGSALLAPRTIAGAAALGAGMGAIQPVAGEGERGINTGLGAVAGAAIPAIVRGARALKATTEPFYDQGQQNIIGRLLRRAAGSDADGAAERLRQASQPFVGPTQPGMGRQTIGEIVPGSVPTVGQASGNAGIAAVERSASAIDPTVTNEFTQRMAQQNEARSTLLQSMTGSDGAREMFGAARDATAESLYKKAFKKGISAKVAEKMQPQISALLENPAIQDAIPMAKRLAKFDGIDISDPQGSLQGLHYVKLAIDEMLDKGRKTGLGRVEERKIMQTKDALLGLMDRLSPAYGTARAEFQAASRPLNQMDTLAEIAKKAIDPKQGQVQLGNYARALSDKTAQSATGFRKATLEGTLEPQQLGQLGAVLEDLRRADIAGRSRGSGSDTVQKLAYSNLIDSAGVPTWLRALAPAQVAGNVASRGADALYGRANKEMANRLAMALLNSEEAAAMMAAANRPTPQIAAALRKAGTPLLMSAPGLINAQKQ